jgi:CheY-like chemotaxis protein
MAGMLKFLLVTQDRNILAVLASALSERQEVEFLWAESGAEALDLVSAGAIDLVVSDEELGDMNAIELATRMVRVNPMIHCACVSPLTAPEFHEISEGLGLLAQLPRNPGKRDAEYLLERLKEVKGLTAGWVHL